MFFKTTEILLETIKPYIKNTFVNSSIQNKNYQGHTYASDLINIDSENHVGFEVFENVVIIFYFAGHYHFEDCFSELQNGENNYIERAEIFLKELFENRIRHIEYYKGKHCSAKNTFYYITINDGRKDVCIGNTHFRFLHFFNPLGKIYALYSVAI